MKTSRMRVALGAALLTAAAVGCVDMTGPGLSTSPNQPTLANANLLFASVQSFQQAGILGDLTRYVSIWDQQLTGIARQWNSYDAYRLVDENLLGFDNFYDGGGLVDLRQIQSLVKATDKKYYAIAQLYEAMIMSIAADMWGDIPYIQAAQITTYPTPKLTRQDTVYTLLLTLCDSALANLAAGTGTGPVQVDLVYGGSAAKWTKLAHTLKARIYLHTAKKNGNAAYAAALVEALQGITDATGAGDYNSYQSGTVGEENQWFQFQRNRGTDIMSGAYLVDTLMKARGDPRLASYFAPPTDGGPIKGAEAGYGGSDGAISNLSAVRLDPAFRQPWITYAENQHIIAEAQQRTVSDAAAQASLSAYYTAVGVTPPVPVATLTGTALLKEILTSKYIALFQNLESFNDYRRTCWPNLPLNPTAAAGVIIPGRFYYGLSERQTNPNIPTVSTQQLNKRTFMDANATAMATIGGAPGSCLGQ